MNRVVVSVLAVAVFAAMAGATTVTCPAPPSPDVPVDVSGLTIMCGGLTFTDFNVIPATGFSNGAGPIVSLVSADLLDGFVNLQFNPNLSASTGAQDLHMYYTVNGSVDAVDLSAGGSQNATIIEKVCESNISSGGPAANTCADNSAPVATLVAVSNPPGPDRSSQSIQTGGTSFSTFSDVGVAANQLTAGGGAMSSFTQSWHDAAIPEPASMLLIGSGFLALGLLRRRIPRA